MAITAITDVDRRRMSRSGSAHVAAAAACC